MPVSVAGLNPEAGQNEYAQNDKFVINIEVDPTLTANLPMGTLVELESYTASITGDGVYVPPAVPVVQPSATTADFLLLGVVLGGSSRGSAAIPGGIAQVCVDGICQVLCDNTTTVGHPLVQSTSIAGAAHDNSTTAVLGKTIGTALQAVTISSGTALVWSYIHKM